MSSRETERRLVIVSWRQNNNSFDDTCEASVIIDDSWEELLDVSVRLNGERYECRLRDLVAGVDDLKNLMDGQPSLLLALARLSQPLRMGQELQTLPEYYVHRKLVEPQYKRNDDFSETQEYKIEEQEDILQVLDAASNVVIVQGVPGVGKSKMMSYVAKQIKDRDPACWLLRVNLWECYTVLDESTSGVTAVEGILNASLPNKDEMGRLEYALLRHSLLQSPRVVCLVDGFDEVCPKYMEKCLEALPLLAPRKGKLAVTTRPGHVKLLEDRLGVRAYSLEIFSISELEEFLEQHKLSTSLLSTRLMNLLRIPQYAGMFPSMSEEETITENILTLYEAFIRKDFKRLYKEQRRENLSAPGKEREVEEVQERYEEQWMLLAASTLLSSDDLPPRPSFNRDYFMKPGIVYELPNGEPAFQHMSFAEYFLAKWCVYGDREKSDVARVYCDVYRAQRLELFLEFFNRMAVRGLPVLEAVLDSNAPQVMELLRKGADPMQTDMCGRNVLHLSCSCQEVPVPVLWQYYRYAVLQRMLSAEDSFLGWTPLRYAAERGDWISVYWLVMRAGCDLRLLGDFAKQLPEPAWLQDLFEREGYDALYQHVINENRPSHHRSALSTEIQVAVSLMSADMPEDTVKIIAKKASEKEHKIVEWLLLLIYCGEPLDDVICGVYRKKLRDQDTGAPAPGDFPCHYVIFRGWGAACPPGE